MSDSKFSKALKRLRRLLRSFGSFRKRWAVLDGVSKFVVVAPGLALLWFVVDWQIGLPAWPLFLSAIVVVLVALFALVKWLVLPQFRRVRIEREAIAIEQLHGELDNKLIGSLQFGGELEADQSDGKDVGHSIVFVRALVERTGELLKDLRPKSLVDLKQEIKHLLAAICVGVAVACCVVFAADAIMQRVDRLKDAYAVVLDALFPVDMVVEPGDVRMVRGRSLKLVAKVAGARRDEILLIMEDGESGDVVNVPLKLVKKVAEYQIDAVPVSFSYEFEYAGRRSEKYLVEVADLPKVQAMNFEVTPPPYTGLPMRMLTGRIAKMKGFSGTSVLMSFAANTLLHPEGCSIEWQSGKKAMLDVSGRFGTCGFVISRTDRAFIKLTGAFGKGFEMENPVSFEVSVQKDKVPTVQWTTKIKESSVSAGIAGRPFGWFAKDDIGVSEAVISYEVEPIAELAFKRPKRKGSKKQTIDPPRDRAKGRFSQVFSGMFPRLLPGDQVKMKLGAKDNNTETGPGFGRARPIEFLVIGLDVGDPDFGGDVGWQDKENQQGALIDELPEILDRDKDLMAPPERMVRTQTGFTVKKPKVKASSPQEMVGGVGADDIAIFRTLLSGSERED